MSTASISDSGVAVLISAVDESTAISTVDGSDIFLSLVPAAKAEVMKKTMEGSRSMKWISFRDVA